MSDQMAVDAGRLITKIGDNGYVRLRNEHWLDISEDGMTGRTFVNLSLLVKAELELEKLRRELEWMGPELRRRRDAMKVLREMNPCQSDRDGDCKAEDCPQKFEYLQSCPLFDWDHDEEGFDILPPIPTTT